MTHAISERRRALLSCASVAITALACAALMTAAVILDAPAGALPFLVVTCIACPMAAAFELARAVAVLRDPHAELRSELDRLPETPHPLGF